MEMGLGFRVLDSGRIKCKRRWRMKWKLGLGSGSQGLGLLRGSWDLVSRLLMEIAGVIVWITDVIRILTKAPWPSKLLLLTVLLMLLRNLHSRAVDMVPYYGN